MKILVHYLFLLNVSWNLLFAQDVWTVQNPFPSEAFYKTVEAVTNNNIIIGGSGGIILKTNEAGDTWTVNKIKNEIEIRNITFTDSLNGLLIGSRHLYTTDDGGDSWSEVMIDADLSYYSLGNLVCFEKTIYLFLKPPPIADQELNSLLYISKDRGNSWIQMDQEIEGRIQTTFFLNVDVGFLLAKNEYLYFYKTYDGGNHWNKIEFIAADVGVEPGMFFFNETTGFIGQYRTNDGGITWENTLDSLNGSIYSIYFLDSLNGWLVNDNKIFNSVNGGLSWHLINQASSDRLLDISFSNNGTGWIVGWEGNIFRKNATRNNWEELSKGVRNTLSDIFFINENKGWSVGSSGLILHTQNGGVTWDEQNSNIKNTLYKVIFLNSLQGWILGHKVVLNTFDGGNNWVLRDNIPGEYVDIGFFDDKNGLLIGSSGVVLVTHDNGENWNKVDSISSKLTSLSIINKNEAWIGGGGVLGYTDNKGNSINWYDMPNLALVNDMQFINDTEGFLCDNMGGFYKSYDRGFTWNKLPREEELIGDIRAFTAINSDTVWMCIGFMGGYIWQVTTEPVVKITEIPEYWGNSINSIYFINPNLGWAVGDGGTILKYEKKITDVKNYLHSSSKSDYSLELYQNYPNPFNPSTIISYHLPSFCQVKLSVYDLLGREVIVLVDNEQPMGKYEVVFDGTDLASGIYLVRLETEINQKIVKVILMK